MRSGGPAHVNRARFSSAPPRPPATSGVMFVAAAPSYVKGIWFRTARRYLVERHGERTLVEVAAAMGEHGDALREPLASEWYPEEALQAGLAAMRRVLADGDPERLAAIFETCTAYGIHTFFRALIRLGTPGMVLRKVPTMWSHIRRSGAAITVEADAACAVVRYERFPYFYDANYRILTVASLRALVRLCAGREPRVEIVHYDRDALELSIAY